MLPPGFEPRSSDRKSEMIGFPQRKTPYVGFSSDRTTPRELYAIKFFILFLNLVIFMDKYLKKESLNKY